MGGRVKKLKARGAQKVQITFGSPAHLTLVG